MTATPMTRPTALTLPDGVPAAAAWTLHPELRHLNHGSYGAVPAEVQAHQNALRTQMEAAPVIWFGELPPKVAAARAEIARFLDVSVDETAFVPNASGGASVVYASLPLRAGGEIVVTDHGYGAVTMGA
ncbi:MAG TPA: hypothetical protein VFX61_21800, partial [Micromonosporaceae bacterium]|nr:hypothetical protein [Micromonosporaceae bacterium]